MNTEMYNTRALAEAIRFVAGQEALQQVCRLYDLLDRQEAEVVMEQHQMAEDATLEAFGEGYDQGMNIAYAEITGNMFNVEDTEAETACEFLGDDECWGVKQEDKDLLPPVWESYQEDKAILYGLPTDWQAYR